MDIAAPSTNQTWEELVRAWKRLSLPRGWSTEIIGEQLLVFPNTGREHYSIVDTVARSLYRALPPGIALFQAVGTWIEPRAGLHLPALVAAARNEVPDETGCISGGNALLTVEITTTHRSESMHRAKRSAYATSGVPAYLLIDRFAEHGAAVELCCAPDSGTYLARQRVPFGKPLTLPEPFDVTIETEDFPR